MSVIHEALKRNPKEDPAPVPAKRPVPPASVPASRKPGSAKAWLIAGVSIWVALTALYWREFRTRETAQAKLQAALLQLNDARNEAERASADKARALAEANAVSAKHRQVEYDNFEKEKKIAELAKEVHELKMSKATPPQV